ncbi:MAG: PCI domain-containing protein [Promethearchaeota archaeon]
MDISPKIKNSIKVFASEAGRFKLQDLASILGVDEKRLEEILNNLISMGELEGAFANKNSEFVTKIKLKQEVLMILDNPSLIEPFNYVHENKIDGREGKNIIITTSNEIKKCPKCNSPIKTGGKFCPQCGQAIG